MGKNYPSKCSNETNRTQRKDTNTLVKWLYGLLFKIARYEPELT